VTCGATPEKALHNAALVERTAKIIWGARAMGATIHPLPDIPLRIVSAMQFPDCDPSDPSTLKASIGGHDVKAKDCADLAKQIADLQQKGWRTVNPKLEQTRVDAGHDGLIDQAGDQIAAIILDLVAQARSAT